MMIDTRQLEDFSVFQGDAIGKIYKYNESYIRVIDKQYHGHVKRVFLCGVIHELEENHLIPKTKISQLHIISGDLLVESEEIKSFRGIQYYSFEMIKATAITVLKIQSILSKYGYELKDCHIGNILFDGCFPVFVDFGSIVRIKNQGVWQAKNEFLMQYYYPLLFWKEGIEEMSLLTKYGITLDKMRHLYYRAISDSAIELLSKFNENEAKLLKRIQAIEVEKDTRWGEYQNDFWENRDKESRFDFAIKYINQLKSVESAIELGANQGFFSWLLVKRAGINRVIASDYDKKAVDKMLLRLQTEDVKDKISPMVLDFTQISNEELGKLKCDIVIANALTHHLLLTQHMNIVNMMLRLSLLTSRYVIVEFMPLGLWYGKKKCRLPEWYTLEWFLEAFSKYFTCLEKKQVGKNRIVIIGEKEQ